MVVGREGKEKEGESSDIAGEGAPVGESVVELLDEEEEEREELRASVMAWTKSRAVKL